MASWQTIKVEMKIRFHLEKQTIFTFSHGNVWKKLQKILLLYEVSEKSVIKNNERGEIWVSI